MLQWFFQTGPSKDASGRSSPPCQMGFWISSTAGAAGRPGTITSSSKAMNISNPHRQCNNIFQTMLNAAASQVPKSIGSSINLQQNPATASGQFELPGGLGTGTSYRPDLGVRLLMSTAGKAVDAGYPSYVLAFNTTWTPDPSQSPYSSSPSGAPNMCTDTATAAPCVCGSSATCQKPNSGAPTDQKLCRDTATAALCPCGSTPTCSDSIDSTSSSGSHQTTSCVDSETGGACTCGSSATCSVPGTPPQRKPYETCLDSQTGQVCTCGSSKTCPNPSSGQPTRPLPPKDCRDSETGMECYCGLSITCSERG